MKTFHIFERPDGRIVLTTEQESKSRFIRSIKAANWKAARLLVDDSEFFHDPGHGWYITPRPGAYPRQREYHERKAQEALRMLKLFASINESAIRPKKLTSRAKEYSL